MCIVFIKCVMYLLKVDVKNLRDLLTASLVPTVHFSFSVSVQCLSISKRCATLDATDD